MLEAKAIKGFRRSDTRTWVKRGNTMTGDDAYIKDLERVGNVRITKAIDAAPENKALKKKADGKKSSALPVAQVSRSNKFNGSNGGGMKKVAKKKPARKKR